jgi:hypothetical protein
MMTLMRRQSYLSSNKIVMLTETVFITLFVTYLFYCDLFITVFV